MSPEELRTRKRPLINMKAQPHMTMSSYFLNGLDGDGYQERSGLVNAKSAKRATHVLVNRCPSSFPHVFVREYEKALLNLIKWVAADRITLGRICAIFASEHESESH